VDGKPAEVLAADHAFRAVQLDAGKHSIVFEYTPSSFRLGAWITALAILSLLIALIASWRRGSLESEAMES
jgi:uncharacterized membrane protein YfhO